MAGTLDNPNLIGSPLDSKIVEQFRRRSQRVNQTGVRTDQAILDMGSNNCWVRLSSFVSVDASGLADIKAGTNNEIEVQAGTYLAKNWALKSEVRNAGGLKYGVNSLAGAYGTGGIKELGYRPMPGITGVTIESQPPLGAIKSSVVKIKVWNLNQLSILDILYFRLGFTMLLEWGHSIFTNNNGELVTNPIPLDVFSTSGQALTKEDILKQLAKKREDYSHNYDGSLALVTNYSWTQAGDGSYDCTLNLVGLGSVVESLKINTQDAMPDLPTPTGGTSAQTSTTDDCSLLGFITLFETTDVTTAEAAFSKGADLLNNPTQDFEYGYSVAYRSLPFGATIPSTLPKTDDRNLRVRYKANLIEATTTQTQATKEQSYMKLGYLLAYLNNSCLLYAENKPYIPIDFNTNTNFCLRMAEQFSIDPKVCLVDTDCSNADYGNLLTVKSKSTKALGVPKSPSNGSIAAGLATTSGGYIDGTKGKFMNIYVNTTCIREVIAECTDGQKNVYLGNFVTKLMSRIQAALGNINNFKLGYSDISNTCYIYDAQLVDVENTKAAIPALPVFGLQSIAREYNLKTEASTRIGSMLAITARAGAVNTGQNSDGTAFTVLNKSLSDRLLVDVSTSTNNAPATSQTRPTTVSAVIASNTLLNTGQAPQSTPAATAATPTTTDGAEALAVNFNTQVQNIYGLITANVIVYNTAAIESVKNYYIDALLRIKGKLNPSGTGDSIAATGVLPLALNMTVDGIGGIPLYQAFTLPANRLPVQYVKDGQPRIAFSVAGINHTIENNQWTTAIRGLMINIPEGVRTYTPNYRSKQNTANNVIGCTFNPCSRGAGTKYKSTTLYQDTRFRAEVTRLTKKYNLSDPDALYKVMYAESKLDPKATLIKNKVRKTAGLIQFTNATVPQIVPSLEVVLNTSAVDQMKYVEKYFDSFGSKVQGADAFRLYSLVFFPLIANYDNDPNWIVQSSGLSATEVSLSNPAIACAAGKTPGTPLTVADFRQYVSCIS